MAKNRTQMRSDLRLELKDSGALWTDAELNRCVERAVSDFNRYLPDEKTYELSLQFTVTAETVTFPAAADPDKVVDGADISATVAGGILTIAAQPDVPRPLVLTITDTDAGITKLILIVKGSDKDGLAVEETFYYYKGLTSVTGKQYFRTVNEVEVDQITGNAATDKLDLGTTNYYDVRVYLANNPVKDASESGVDATSTKVVRNTDYYIDYIAGAIKAINGGIIAAGEACVFSYEKMQLGIDLSDIHGLVRVQRAEYPIGEVPQNFITFDTFGNQLFVTGSGESGEQQRMAEDEHIRLYYDAEHIAPNDFAPGTIPTFLEDTVILIASAYALLIKGIQYEHQAVTDFASARTSLTDISKVSWGTALTAAAAQFAAVAAAFGAKTAYITGAITGAGAPLVLAEAALLKMVTYLENNSNEDSKGWLTKITTDIAGLRTAIITAGDACNAYLDTIGAASTGDLVLAAGVWTDQDDNIVSGTLPNAEDYLTTWDDKINLVNKGNDVAELGRRYADTSLEIAKQWADKRKDFISQAGRRAEAAYYYTMEMAQRLSNLRSYIEQAEGWGNIAERFGTQAAHYISDASVRMRAAEASVNDAASLVGAGNGYVAEAESRQVDIGHSIDTADRYTVVANYNLALAERFKADAYERRNEIFSIWRDRKQYIGDFTAGSVRQMPTYDR